MPELPLFSSKGGLVVSHSVSLRPRKIVSAVLSEATVWTLAGATCLHRGHEFRPVDIEDTAAGGWRRVCVGCHVIDFEIEPRIDRGS